MSEGSGDESGEEASGVQDEQADDSAKPAAAPSELGDADLDLLASLNAAGDFSTSPHEL